MDDEQTVSEEETFADPETSLDDKPFGARSDGEIAALVEGHLSLLPPIARRLRRDIGSAAEVDELLAAGREALFEAARVYDPTRSPFAAFATSRARWAMIDAVRRETHSRGQSARIRAIAAMTRVDESAVATEAAEPTEESNRDHLRSLLAAEAGALFMGLATGDVREVPDPEESLSRARKSKALREALEDLPERERTILERHYFVGERFEAIAEALSVSKSWLSRIHARALVTLGAALAEH